MEKENREIWTHKIEILVAGWKIEYLFGGKL